MKSRVIGAVLVVLAVVAGLFAPTVEAAVRRVYVRYVPVAMQAAVEPQAVAGSTVQVDATVQGPQAYQGFQGYSSCSGMQAQVQYQQVQMVPVYSQRAYSSCAASSYEGCSEASASCDGSVFESRRARRARRYSY